MLHSTFKSFGQPTEVTELTHSESPALQAGEIRVRMIAAPINPADINLIQGVYGIRPELPATPGIEGVGTITATQSDDFQLGDRVIFIKHVGSWSEEVTCSASSALKIPSTTPSDQASMLKVNPLTAWCMLTQLTDLPKGSWVIQNASNSGVGTCVIQIAKLLGLRTINMVRREELIPQLTELGGDLVLLDSADAVAEIKKITADAPPQLALNAVGGDSALRLMDALATKGLHVTYGAMSRRSLKVPNKFLIFKRIQLHGFWLTEWLKEQNQSDIQSAYAQLAQWMIDGDLSQPIDSTFPLSDVQSAITRACEDKRNGKVLIII